MNIDNLNKLKNLLVEDSPIRWNFGEWGNHYGDHPPEEQNFCQTEACALGLAALSGRFPEISCRWERLSDIQVLSIFPTQPPVNSCGSKILDAAMVAFGLNYTQAQYIFTMDSYRHAHLGRYDVTKSHVISHIDDVLGGAIS